MFFFILFTWISFPTASHLPCQPHLRLPHTDGHHGATGSDLQENKVILEGTTSCSSVLSAAAAAAPTTLTLGREEDGMCGAARMPLPK